MTEVIFLHRWLHTGVSMGRLTDSQLKGWMKAGKRIAGKSDGGGLTFTLSAAGTAAWVFRYRFAGRPRELTLGNYPDISLKEARKLATAARAQVDQLIDPAAEKRRIKAEARRTGTVDELFRLFYRQTILPKYKHPEVVERVFRRDILPQIGKKPAREVVPADIDSVLRRIVADRRPTVANDALRLMRKMFRFASKRQLVGFNPAADFDLADAGGKEQARQRALSRDELKVLFRSMREAGPAFTRDNELAVKLLLSLAVRKMELLAARWEEFDLDAAIWRLPAERSKAGRGIDIPLAEHVLGWLQELQVRACLSPYVFPSRRASKRFPHVGPDTLNAALKALPHGLEPFTVHDFRRTARTLLSSLGVRPHVAERCLNHKLRGVQGVYDTHDCLDERRQALGRLADLIVRLERGEDYNVIALRGCGV